MNTSSVENASEARRGNDEDDGLQRGDGMTSFDAELTILLATGTEVEVLTRYERRWATGFEIAAVDDAGFLLRRQSDGALLPAAFSAAELRPRR
jgi:hypothetical protein